MEETEHDGIQIVRRTHPGGDKAPFVVYNDSTNVIRRLKITVETLGGKTLCDPVYLPRVAAGSSETVTVTIMNVRQYEIDDGVLSLLPVVEFIDINRRRWRCAGYRPVKRVRRNLWNTYWGTEADVA